jgi:hypothetical protein
MLLRAAAAAGVALLAVFAARAHAANFAVSGLTAAKRATNNAPVLNWNPTSGAVTYRIYRDGQFLTTVTSPSFTDQSLSSDGIHTYGVRGIASNGTVSSAAGIQVTYDTEAPQSIPNAPTGESETTSFPTFSWAAVSDVGPAGIARYNIRRDGVFIGSVPAGTLSFTDTGVGSGQYTYIVRARDRAGNKAIDFSPPFTVTVDQPPSAPTDLATSASGGTSIPLTWSPVSGADAYDVFENGTNIATVGGTSYTFTGLMCGTTYTLGVMTKRNGVASALATIVASTLACSSATADMGATGYRELVQPAFTPVRTMIAATPGQFLNDLANLQPGDDLEVDPMTIPGEVKIANVLSSPAEINFAPGVSFTGSATDTDLPAVWIVGAKNVRLDGGDLTNPGGGAILVYDSTNIQWWHFKAHDAGGGCLSVFNVNSGSSGLDFDGELSNCGNDLTDDPHAEKGTGQHGAYIGGGNTAFTVANSKFSLYIHDQRYGAALQAGSNLTNDEFWVKAENVTFQAQSQVAGNAIQFWGGALNNITVHEVTGENLAGRLVETNGMYDTGNSNIVVDLARGTNTLMNPLLSGGDCAPNPAVTYEDCS